ncbi:MAG: class I SAM-dependent methyltransferase [Pseudomonadota bacterium]
MAGRKDGEVTPEGRAHYFAVGESAMRSIRQILGDLVPLTILDLPCGHGRVARHLTARFPEAELFVADLNEDGARFCAAELGAEALTSTPDFSALDFGRRFDLIWVGSLVTHLNAPATQAFLGFVARHLTDRGRAVVTAHGALVAGRMMGRREAPRSLIRRRGSLYGISLPDTEGLCRDYFATGYGYRNYPYADDYGVSICTEPWMRAAAAAAGLETTSFVAHAWDNHQDVYGLALAA